MLSKYVCKVTSNQRVLYKGFNRAISNLLQLPANSYVYVAESSVIINAD